MSRLTLLNLQAPADEALWRAALASHNVPSVCMQPAEGIVEQVQRDARLSGARAILVDVPSLASQALSAASLVRRLRRVNAEIGVFLLMPGRARADAQQGAWARSSGLVGLLPGTSAARWRESLAPPLGQVLEHVGRGPLHVERVGEFLRVLEVGQAGGADAVGEAFDAADRVAVEGLDLEALAAELRGPGGVPVEDRGYRGKTYRQCFVASDAVRWLAQNRRLKRGAAVLACRAMQHFDAIHHVVREKSFDDAFLFFRFAQRGAEAVNVELAEIAAAMRAPGGVDIADRGYRGKTYPRCFVGSAAVDWMAARYRLSIGEAEAVGQRLLDVGIIRHVVDEHGFSDAGYYYAFVER